MSKYNFKSVAILACLLSCNSVTNAHNAQRILKGKSNLRNQHMSTSSTYDLTKYVLPVGISSVGVGIGMCYIYKSLTSFDGLVKENKHEDFLSKDSDFHVLDNSINIPKFVYDNNGKKIYIYKADDLKNNPIAKKIIYDRVYSGPVGENTLKYWQEIFYNNCTKYFGLVGKKLEDIVDDDYIHFKLYINWFNSPNGDVSEFFDSNSEGDAIYQLNKSISKWRKYPSSIEDDFLLNKANKNIRQLTLKKNNVSIF